MESQNLVLQKHTRKEIKTTKMPLHAHFLDHNYVTSKLKDYMDHINNMLI